MKVNGIPVSNRDWPDDLKYENGNYMNSCRQCDNTFYGHKRRIHCQLCAMPHLILEWAGTGKPQTARDLIDSKQKAMGFDV